MAIGGDGTGYRDTVESGEQTGQPVPPPSPHRAFSLRLGLALATITALLSAPAAVAVGRGWLHGGTGAGAAVPASARTVAGKPPLRGAAGQHDQDGPQGAHRTELGDRIQDALNAQAAALLSGDENGFLAGTDPKLQPDLKRRFGVLRAMHVAGWDETVADGPDPVGDARWKAQVRLRYCFAVPGCAPTGVTVHTEWTEVDGRLRLSAMGTSDATDLGPRPWEVADLRVAVGARTIVATTPRYANRLPAALAGAEQAAEVVDRYARWAPPPGRYLVYLAGGDEWGRWYGVHQPSWVAGYAMPVADDTTEIILNAQCVGSDAVLDTLRHEFTHVVTLVGVRRDYSAQWWLVEGIAEYVRMVGRPLGDYAGYGATHRYVHSGRWDGTVALGEPPDSSSTDDASGRYGVAFLSLRRIADRFGEDALLNFFDAVIRKGTDPSAAAPAVLGASWDDVRADCARYVRRTIG